MAKKKKKIPGLKKILGCIPSRRLVILRESAASCLGDKSAIYSYACLGWSFFSVKLFCWQLCYISIFIEKKKQKKLSVSCILKITLNNNSNHFILNLYISKVEYSYVNRFWIMPSKYYTFNKNAGIFFICLLKLRFTLSTIIFFFLQLKSAKYAIFNYSFLLLQFFYTNSRRK